MISEFDLRESIVDAAADIDANSIDPVWVIDRSRSRTRRGIITGAGIAVTLMLVTSWLVASRDSASNPPAHNIHRTTNPTVDTAECAGESCALENWVEAMPDGEVLRVPYTINDVFHGSEGWGPRVHDGYAIEDEVPRGLIVVGATKDQFFHYGIASDDDVGWFTQARFGLTAALSRDGRTITIMTPTNDWRKSFTVFDLDNGRESGSSTTPFAAGFGVPTTRGVVFNRETGRGDAVLWSASDGYQQLELPVPFAVDTDLTAALAIDTGDNTCSGVYRIADDLTSRRTYDGCGPLRALWLSPGGTYALTRDLHVVDVDTGALTNPFAFPGRNQLWIGNVVWEDDSDAIISLITSPDTAPVARQAVVRCLIAEGGCERVMAGIPANPATARGFRPLDMTIGSY